MPERAFDALRAVELTLIEFDWCTRVLDEDSSGIIIVSSNFLWAFCINHIHVNFINEFNAEVLINYALCRLTNNNSLFNGVAGFFVLTHDSSNANIRR